MTFWLVLINVVVFVLQLFTAEVPGRIDTGPLTEWGVFYLPDILNGQVWRLFTFHFLHADLIHLFVNMFVLYFFGREVEGIYGSREYLFYYLAAALIVSLGKVALGLIELARPAASLGASGAVMAVFILYAWHYPFRTIYVMFIIPMPVWLLATAYVVFDLLGFVGRANQGVDNAAHLLGALFAFLYYRYHWRVSGRVDWLSSQVPGRRRASSPRLYVEADEPGETVGARTNAASAAGSEGRTQRALDEQLEAKLDHVLEKVSRYGRESLTPEERDLLLRASEIYKRRRGN